MMDMAIWLGDEFDMGGICVRCPDVYKAAVTAALAAGSLSVDDVPADDSLDDAQFKYLLEVFDAAARAVHKAANKGDDIADSDVARWKKWLSLRWQKSEDVVTTTPSKALSAGEQAQLRADLNPQGMNSLAELAWFILTLHGGRPATASGTAGACYLQSPTEMPGGVLLRKSKSRVYTEVLHDASISGSADEHDRWFTSLMDRLDHAPVEYAKNAALLLLKVQQKVRDTFRGDSLCMQYWIRHNAKYEARGFPHGSELDPTLVSVILAGALSAPPALPLKDLAGAKAASTVGGSSSSGSSALGSSVSSAGALGEMMELLKAVSQSTLRNCCCYSCTNRCFQVFTKSCPPPTPNPAL